MRLSVRQLKRRARQHGFTLIEMIGVLAVISILAAVMVPNVVQTVDYAVADAEAKNLETLSGALSDAIRTNKAIPNAANWAAVVAANANLAANKVTLNERGFRRGYYVDPRFFTNINTVFAGYTQGAGLTTAPVSPRIMIVSNLSANAPAAPTTSAAFSQIWDQTGAPAVVEGTKVKITRIHLGAQFLPVLITNQNTSAVAYQVGSSARINMPAVSAGGAAGVTRYLLKHSSVSLYKPPFATGALARTLLVTTPHDLSYVSSGGATPVWAWSVL
jgi:prepilin-type N-terminal cleavage/methylation domain-containing protein